MPNLNFPVSRLPLPTSLPGGFALSQRLLYSLLAYIITCIDLVLLLRGEGGLAVILSASRITPPHQPFFFPTPPTCIHDDSLRPCCVINLATWNYYGTTTFLFQVTRSSPTLVHRKMVGNFRNVPFLQNPLRRIRCCPRLDSSE